jgi:hypothetical protein
MSQTNGQEASLEPGTMPGELDAAHEKIEANKESPEAPGNGKTMPRSAVQIAFKRAQEKLEAASEQAEKPGTPETVIPPSTVDDDQSATGTGPPSEKSEADPDSIAAAPDDWPERHKVTFAGLPKEARATMLDFYSNMQAGFTKAMQHVSDLKGLSEQMSERGIDIKALEPMLDVARTLQNEPRQAIQNLAASQGLNEIYFEREQSLDELPPEAATDPQAFYAHVKKGVMETLRAEQAREAEKTKSKAQQQQAQERLRNQFIEAQKLHPDFLEHKAGILDAMTEDGGFVSVEDAYRLATYPSLAQGVKSLDALKTENAALKAQLEKIKKGSTRPMTGTIASGKPNPEEARMSPVEKAYLRAQRKVNAKK